MTLPDAEQLLDLHIEHLTLPQNLDGGMVCRWMPEVEFALVRQGPVDLQAGGETLTLGTGDGLFFNADCLHTAWAIGHGALDFISFPARLACGPDGGALAAQYAVPLLTDVGFPFLKLTRQNERHVRMLSILERIAGPDFECLSGGELLCKGEVCALWALLCEEHRAAQSAGAIPAQARELSRLRQALAFLHERYAEKLSLDSIAEVCGVSKSECCRLFQRTLRQTPFDYLLRYRVYRSIPLLLEGNFSITEIAWITGFSGASYFSEIFRRYYGCSPTEYRKVGGFPFVPA